MKIFKYLLAGIMALTSVSLNAQETSTIPAPESYFGFKPGADRMLFSYEKLIAYLKEVDKVSDRLKLLESGRSPMGRPMYIAFISSAENINNLEELKKINEEMAMNPAIPKAEKQEMLEDGKVFFLATLSMHSTEVGPSQSAPLLAYNLCTTEDPEVLQWLNDVVYMMIPCHNPDGMDMIVEHYNKYKGTKYEGSSMPGVYHKYVGHDNNRDFLKLSQEDTRVIARIYNTEWYPQVMVEKHQMGSTGVRYFVPPPHDPIAQNVDAAVWNWVAVFGSNMITDMTNEGMLGVSQHYLFDDYWPGSTNTCIWKNVIAFLTECASVKTASPIYVEHNELGTYGKGLAEYEKGINMPAPWPGGWWKLGDIIDYEISSTMSIIKTASLHRKEILEFRNDMCKKEVQKGKETAPFYYVIPLQQHDQSELAELVNLMMEHGVTAYQLNGSFRFHERTFEKGDIVFPLAQAYRAFIKEALEAQQFPVRHYTPNGVMIKPYDITSWSLPLHNGVKAYEINKVSNRAKPPLQAIKGDFAFHTDIPEQVYGLIFTVNNNSSFKAAFLAKEMGFKVDRMDTSFKYQGKSIPKGSFVVYEQEKADISELLDHFKVSPVIVTESIDIPGSPFDVPKIALVETNMHDMDAGWTRFIFDQYHVPFHVLKPEDFEKKDLLREFDVIIFPGARKSILKEGKYQSGSTYYVSSYPPEFSKGMGKKGFEKLMTFLDEGGTIVSWGRSTELFMGTLNIKHGENDTEEFQLPIRDISKQLDKDFYCPGSFLKMKLRKHNMLTLGMKDETGIFYRGAPLFSTSLPRFDMNRRVIGYFPKKDILLSGYLKSEEEIADKTVMAWIKKGKGQLVLMAFHPQFRASTGATYKLLFNSLLLPEIEN